MKFLTNTSCRMVNKILRRLQSSSTVSSTTSSNVDIKIPDRIERGPTDILRALEKTISRDLSTPHYKYFNDPFLVPTSKQAQRNYALSLESGRKTAIWVHKEHGDLFRTDIADPVIEEFMPPIEYKTKDQVSEEILLKTISHGKTTEALHIYNLLEENVSNKAKQNLLELLCFTNSKDLSQFTFQEERWYKFSDDRKKRNTWTQTADIEKLFNFLTSQDAETAAAAYNAVICGKAKYLNIQEAWPLYLQCCEKKIPLNVNTYNAIIKIISFVAGHSTDPVNMTYKILQDMSTNGIRPNLGTLNSCLEIIYSLRSYNLAEEFIQTLFKEFNSIGIKPSLASYCYVLHLESKNDNSAISMLNDIINALQKDNPELRDPADVNFFPMAMEIAKMDTNLKLGEKIHDLLLKDNNYKFIANAYSENIYYRHYVSLKLATLPIEKFFEFYYQLSKHLYIPEQSIVENILETLKLQSNEIIIEHLPKLLSQIYMFNMLSNSRIVKLTLQLTCQCNLEQDSPLHKTFASFAWDYWQFNQKIKSSDIRKFIWDIDILKDILLLLLRDECHNQVHEIISFMIHNENLIMGKLDAIKINELLEICISRSYGSIAILLIEWSTKSGLRETGSMAKKVNDIVPLTAVEKEKLISLVGNDVLELKLSD
ncbi:PREDICTED: protein PTCD3 homolog, mitochondrial [Polistes dominula]|uniref:Small ribosomal subunit protein mS39 n=1 Tax=Polistes dominula TaxID=743375 RepID=A0ABM1IQV9_POLDO|nr:PREDICTED: protein PTCD3 homolog, mitochondrial [Polistes dominula]